MSRNVLYLVSHDEPHIVEVRPHRCRFGDTWQPVCQQGPGRCYIGPFVSRVRALAIAEEHRRKSLQTWGPVR